MNVLITERKLLLPNAITFSYHLLIRLMAFVGGQTEIAVHMLN